MADPALKQDVRRDNQAGHRPYHKNAFPLSAPPPRLALPALDPKHAAEANRGTTVDEQLVALHSTRCA